MWRIGLAGLVLLCATFSARADLLSREDQQIYRAAFAVARANDWATARHTGDQAHDPLPGKVLRWLELRQSNTVGFGDIVEFVDRNLDWPLQSVLRERAEQRSGDVPDETLLPYFQKNLPTTPQGRLRLADMLAASGQGEQALALVRKIWLGPDVDPDTEQAILGRFGPSLGPEDHAARLDRLIWDGQISAARRQLQLVPEDQRLAAEARLALAGLETDAEQRLARVPDRLRNSAGLLFEQARWSRRKDRLEEAAAILMNPPAELGRPAAWQTERQILARRLIDSGNDRLAYDVIARHGLREGSAEYADAEFLSGWIALRRLSKPKAAYEHFVRLYAAVKLPISRSRAAYWAGRAAEALGVADDSRRWLTAAAAHGHTYYGQLAAARLGKAVALKFPQDPQPGPEDVAAFDASELVRAARMLSEIGEGAIAKPFLQSLTATARTPGEQKLIAALAEKAGQLDVAVAAAKRVSADEPRLLASGFPLIAIDNKGTAEKPLILAIARQESAFDEAAVSRSDARGLMQLKPSTAKDVARSLSLPFSADRLLTDATYNLTLGHAYLDKMLGTFNGSYALSIAAYNAGPARVTQWLNTHGDPHGGSVDIVDWIELIPFGETRNYVQRVLENLQIYRLRLGEHERAFKLSQDLQR